MSDTYSSSFPAVEDLKLRLIIEKVLQLVCFWLIVLCGYLMLREFLFVGNYDGALHFMILFLLGMNLLWRGLRNHKFLFYAFGSDRLKDGDAIGHYSGKEIREMVSESLVPHLKRKAPAIYMIDGYSGDFLIINSFFFKFIRPFNAIYISKSNFYSKNKEEIQAMLLSESCWFYKYSLPLSRTLVPVDVITALLPAWLAVENSDLEGEAMLFTWFMIRSMVVILVGKWSSHLSKPITYLGDYQAAKRFGKLNTINGFIQLVKHVIFYASSQEFFTKRKLKSDALTAVNLENILLETIKKMEGGSVSIEQIKSIINGVQKDGYVLSIREKLNEEQLDQEAKDIKIMIEEILDHSESKLGDWDAFDLNIKNGRVDEVEYPQLIELLKEKEGQPLFDLITYNEAKNQKGKHPTLRERILFLDSCDLAL